MSKLTLSVFDPNITQSSPAGSCLLKMLRAASSNYELQIFTAGTDLHPSDGTVIHKMPVPMKPVFLQSISFTLLAILLNLLANGGGKRLRISTQGGYPFCDISYAHCCHKLYLTRYRNHITGGIFTRTARLINHQWSAAMEAIAFRCAAVIVTPSEGLARELGSVYGPRVAAKVVVLPNPVDCQAFAPETPKQLDHPFTFAFCALGNFEWKGLGLILQSLAAGVQGNLKVIGGTTSEIDDFRERANSLGVSTRVTFLGLKTDIRPHLWSSDVFVFPSVHETFPLVCLQAAAAGLPLIATNLYGLEQLLKPGISGWRVDRTVESLTAAMHSAFTSRADTGQMGQQAQLLASQYDEPAFIQRWLDLLSKMT